MPSRTRSPAANTVSASTRSGVHSVSLLDSSSSNSRESLLSAPRDSRSRQIVRPIISPSACSPDWFCAAGFCAVELCEAVVCAACFFGVARRYAVVLRAGAGVFASARFLRNAPSHRRRASSSWALTVGALKRWRLAAATSARIIKRFFVLADMLLPFKLQDNARGQRDKGSKKIFDPLILRSFVLKVPPYCLATTKGRASNSRL